MLKKIFYLVEICDLRRSVDDSSGALRVLVGICPPPFFAPKIAVDEGIYCRIGHCKDKEGGLHSVIYVPSAFSVYKVPGKYKK